MRRIRLSTLLLLVVVAGLALAWAAERRRADRATLELVAARRALGEFGRVAAFKPTGP